MSIFTKPEVVILKESNAAKTYLERLENLFLQADETSKIKIQKEIAIVKAGIAGEENILYELKNSDMDIIVLQDVYIETQEDRSAQIDFIVISSKAVFLLECKNLFGNIEINSKGDFIRTIKYGNRYFKEGIYSPITQNERHLSVLKECRTENKNRFWKIFIRKNFDDFYKSLIVLANSKTVVNDRYAKKEVKDKVIRADQLIATMKKMTAESREIPLSKKEMLELAQDFLRRNIEERKDYFIKYENLVREVKESERDKESNTVQKTKQTSNTVKREKSVQRDKEKYTGTCPRCGFELVIRTAQKGTNVGNLFYGCSNFPKCRFVRNIGQPEKAD